MSTAVAMKKWLDVSQEAMRWLQDKYGDVLEGGEIVGGVAGDPTRGSITARLRLPP